MLYAKKENIAVLPPDINMSQAQFSVENGALRFGLAGLKNVGVALIDSIIAEREQNGKFKDFMDFASRVDAQALNKRCLESLILSGAFDGFGIYRSQLMCVFEQVVEKVNKERKTKASGQFSIFDMGGQEVKEFDSIVYPDVKPYTKETKLKLEKDVVGIYISGHPLDDYIDKFKDFNLTSDMLMQFESEESEEESSQESSLEDGMSFVCGGILTEITKKTTKSNREMAFITLEDLYGQMELMMFPNILARYKNDLVEDKMVTIKGKVSIHNNALTLIVDHIQFWQTESAAQAEKKSGKKLYLKYDTKDENLHKAVMKVLEEYQGKSEIVIKCIQTQKVFKVTKTVDISDNLLNDLIGLIKQENVFVREEE